MHRPAIFLLSALIACQTIHSQNATARKQDENILFHHLTTENGLLHDAVTCLLEDKKGYLWIGGHKGLCRYDGARMLSFQKSGDTSGLNDNTILSLSTDSKGRIWLGSFWGGLSMLDESTGKFIAYKNNANANRLLGSNTVENFTFLDSTHVMVTQGDLVIL